MTREQQEDTTAHLHASSVEGFSLLVSCASGVAAIPIGSEAAIVIGRSATCDLPVDDASVSRRHAILRVGGSAMTIENVGGRNGVRVQGKLLSVGETADVAPGTVIELGAATLLLQAGHHAAAPRTLPPAAAGRPRASLPADVVVADPTMRRLYALLDLIAPSPLTVLVLGETGVGKEAFARELHRRSGRAGGPFFKIDCAGLPESLLEAELFGFERGAFTGAVRSKPGLLEAAQAGTLFLDEVGELTLGMQSKLLRVIEDGDVMRLGSVKPFRVDVRFVAATHRDLREQVATGDFRADLYFRLNGFTATLPPLRARRGDIMPLARLFAAKVAQKLGRGAPSIASDAGAALESYSWPGNVRELRNVMERAIVLLAGVELGAAELRAAAPELAAEETRDTAGASGSERGDAKARGALDRAAIVEALAQANGNQTRAAQLIGISRRGLIKKMELFGIAGPRKSR